MRMVWFCVSLLACRSSKIVVADDAVSVVDQDADGVDEGEDCNDLDAAIGPHAHWAPPHSSKT